VSLKITPAERRDKAGDNREAIERNLSPTAWVGDHARVLQIGTPVHFGRGPVLEASSHEPLQESDVLLDCPQLIAIDPENINVLDILLFRAERLPRLGSYE
jgi:hypothetical protein